MMMPKNLGLLSDESGACHTRSGWCLNRMVVNPDHGLIDSPLHPDQVEILPEVAESLKALTECGYVLAVATNQPAAAKGKTSKQQL